MANRPAALRWFGWLVLAGVVFNTLALLLFASAIRADAIASGQTAAGWLMALPITVGSNSLFWWRIARCAGNLARWVYLGLIALSSLQLPGVITMIERYGPLYGVLTVLAFAASFASATLLLRKDVGRWLRSGGREGEVDPALFD